ncbi:hypothetical protein GCM10017750_68060 [Streptomyces racemochromogenes]
MFRRTCARRRLNSTGSKRQGKPPVRNPETARQLVLMLWRCHPTHQAIMGVGLAEARAGRGPTVFGRLVEIIEEELPGGLRLR